MRTTIFASTLLMVLGYLCAPVAQEPGAKPALPSLSDAQMEKFLKDARITNSHAASKGVTNSIRATLTDGALTHDAHIQTIDERKQVFEGSGGTEFNFRDSWSFNVAAYRLDRVLGLNLVPVTVSRRYRGQAAAYTWWVDDVMMDEGGRKQKNLEPPNQAEWNQQMQLVRIFDQLIYNVDRNLGNLLITSGWRVWAIDHTRAFRLQKTLKSPANVTRCDRQVLERLKRLDKPTLKNEMKDFLTDWEIDALLARRDAIVAIIEKAGPSALFDRSIS